MRTVRRIAVLAATAAGLAACSGSSGPPAATSTTAATIAAPDDGATAACSRVKELATVTDAGQRDDAWRQILGYMAVSHTDGLSRMAGNLIAMNDEGQAGYSDQAAAMVRQWCEARGLG